MESPTWTSQPGILRRTRHRKCPVFNNQGVFIGNTSQRLSTNPGKNPHFQPTINPIESMALEINRFHREKRNRKRSLRQVQDSLLKIRSSATPRIVLDLVL